MLNQPIVLLTTRGRRSGRPRTTPLTYMPLDQSVVIYAGARGERSDWYRNLLARPSVLVRVGSRAGVSSGWCDPPQTVGRAVRRSPEAVRPTVSRQMGPASHCSC
ncbi:MAG: nitroreductase family deazaflavin-dependent oxidoreductase [Chloroflexi bacterium]|nr:nitroreductase family deazaflavin-dependent oxidoreductase [Chloroflexota bacterium]